MFFLAAGTFSAPPCNGTPCLNCPDEKLPREENQAFLLKEADDIFQEVSRLRGLPIKSPVQKEFKDKAFFRNYYLQLLMEQYPPERKRAMEKAYAFMGFLPPHTDLIQAYLNVFLGMVQGLYDPQTKTLYLADWADRREYIPVGDELNHL